ncbi:hypothetical protein SAMN05414139_10809 [Burkholderia sp. D7]|jgi:hypothetical protein|nr:hypothetical protein SAMN05414139_10809 [Burkholderia sp. D7]
MTTISNRKRHALASSESREALETRLASYAARTRARATRSVGASVPQNVTVLAGPRRKVSATAPVPRRKLAAG